MDAAVQSAHPTAELAPKPRVGCRWFLSGFLIGFVLFAIFTSQAIPMYDGIANVPLWDFYLREIPKQFRAQPFAPGMITQGNMLSTIAEHLAVSFMCGVVVMGIGWAIRPRRG
ncbi:MAG: hypothetical protein Q8K78_14835 [Planctomycetaceae bacterium]|nr:hypothetical protein [Planctomycetaceae bacterium]